MDSDHYEVQIYRTEATSERVDQCRALVANSPSEWNKLGLATALFLDGQYAECAILSSQIAQTDASKILHAGSGSYAEALLQKALLLKRAKHIYEEEAKQVPGRDAFSMTMEQYDKLVEMYDEEIRNLE